MFQRTLRREGDQLRNVQLCPIYHGDTDYVLDRAEADDAPQLADELMIWLPPNFTLAEDKELLDNIVEFMAPSSAGGPPRLPWFLVRADRLRPSPGETLRPETRAE
jgi:hypothetical protein